MGKVIVYGATWLAIFLGGRGVCDKVREPVVVAPIQVPSFGSSPFDPGQLVLHPGSAC